jgi:hypothetical protein
MSDEAKETSKPRLGTDASELAKILAANLGAGIAIGGANMGAVVGTELAGKRLRYQPFSRIAKMKRVLGARGVPIVEDSVSPIPWIPGGAFVPPGQASEAVSSSPFSLFKLKVSKMKERLANKKGLVLHPRGGSTPMLAHELGHASGADWKNPTRAIAYALGIPVGVLAGLALGMYRSRPDESAGGAFGRGALEGGAVGTVAGLPMLYEEGRASLRGLRAMRGAGYRPAQLARSKGELGLAFLSYLTAAAGSGAAAGGSARMLGRWVKAKREERQQQKNEIGK